MTHDQFAWWLHGFTEITDGAYPTPTQWQTIKDHLDLTFNKVTPNRFETKTDPQYITGCGITPLPGMDKTYCSPAPATANGLICGSIPLSDPRETPIIGRCISVTC